MVFSQFEEVVNKSMKSVREAVLSDNSDGAMPTYVWEQHISHVEEKSI